MQIEERYIKLKPNLKRRKYKPGDSLGGTWVLIEYLGVSKANGNYYHKVECFASEELLMKQNLVKKYYPPAKERAEAASKR